MLKATKICSLLCFYIISYVLNAFSNTLNVPQQFSTIQAALNSAQNGDTVLVQPGVYKENLVWPNINGIKLFSAGDTSNTVIDGQSFGSVIRIVPSVLIDSSTVISGFTIIRGSAQFGGGILIVKANPLLKDLQIKNCNAGDYNNGVYLPGRGGGIYISDSSIVTIRDVSFVSNYSSDGGGGIYINNGSVVNANRVFFLNNSVSFGDWNAYHGGSGAGIEVEGKSTINLFNSIFLYNKAIGGDGSVIRVNDYSNANINNLIAKNNSSMYGQLSVNSFSKLLLRKAEILKNDGISVIIVEWHSDINVTNSTITNNKSVKYTGAAITVANYSSAVIDSTVIAENLLAGIDSWTSATTTVQNTNIVRNEGAAITITSGNITHTTIDANKRGIKANGNIQLQYSNFRNNGVALFNSNNLITIQAINNWWGDSSGPYHRSQNPLGL